MTVSAPTLPRVFISHAHELDEQEQVQHENFIRTLAAALVYSEIDTVVDLYDLQENGAENLTLFMQNGVHNADYVVCVCTRRYVDKMDKPRGGVGMEWRFIAQEVEKDQTLKKFIPIFHRNEGAGRPKILGVHFYVDFDSQRFSDALDNLVRLIHGNPRNVKPKRPSDPSGDGSASASSIQQVGEGHSAPTPPLSAPDLLVATQELGEPRDEAARLVSLSQEQARVAEIRQEMLVALARRYAEGNPNDFHAALAGLGRALKVAHEERERGRLPSNLSDAIDPIIDKVDALNEAGDLDAGAEVIDGELAVMAAEDDARAQKRLRLLDKGIAQAILTRDAEAATRHTLAKLDQDHTPGTPDAFAALLAVQDVWYGRGRDNGLNFDLTVAALLAKKIHARATNAKQRGAALNNLGNALRTLGERVNDNGRLQDAVDAYREALKERTRDSAPRDWAMTQNNLGNALRTLGERKSDTALLHAAVDAHREALKEWTRDRVPPQWAGTQNNLGIALQALGERESKTAHLQEAIAAYREALKEWTRDRVPLDWAMTQNNLGNALQRIGERESDTARLYSAVAAYREALMEYTRARAPLDWAMTHSNLGTALKRLGERESETTRLHAAVAAYREALKEYTRDRVPLDWAMTQNNLGTTLQALGERESKTAYLHEAIAAYREALKEYTRDRVPRHWAAAQTNLGSAFTTLGQRGSDTARLLDAVAAYREALKEQRRDRVPLDWAAAQSNLGNALAILGERESDTARLSAAVAAYREALKEQHRDRVPLDWAKTQQNTAICLTLWGRLEPGQNAKPKFTEALSAVDAALTVYTQCQAPYYVDRATNLRADILAALDALPEPPP